MIQNFEIRFDFFAGFILLGVFQGFFLAYFFLFASAKNIEQNRFLGILLLSLSIIIVDVWLGYSNYMFQYIWLSDFSEPLNFLIGPSVFLYIQYGLNRKYSGKVFIHFVPFLLYCIYMIILFYPQSNAYKYNDYIEDFHPNLNYVNYNRYGEEWMFWLKYRINDFTFIQLTAYLISSFFVIYRKFKELSISFLSDENKNLAWLRSFLFKLFTVLIVFTFIRLYFKNDAGDHIIAAHIAFVIYATSFSILSKSMFFDDHKIEANKYVNSSLTDQQIEQILSKLNACVESEKPYLEPDFSLVKLANKLSVSTHILSQVLNNNIGKNFFEYTADLRVQEALQILSSKEGNYLKIEEIAERVGYNSKSAFNAAFKKFTGKTPSSFRQNNSTNL